MAESLLLRMAAKRALEMGGGGSFDGNGDGEAWHKHSSHFGDLIRVRKIKHGRWNGPWFYERQS